MRGSVPWMLAVICWTAGIAEGNTRAANAANTRGYALHKKKKYREAAVEYRKAIDADPEHLLARYNLACVASMTNDAKTAIAELAWIADRGTWDVAASKVAAKAAKDKELAWIRSEEPSGELLASTKIPDGGVLDLLDKPDPAFVGTPTTDATLVRAMASAPGPHEERCSTTTLATKLEVTKGGTIAANQRDGVVVLDSKGTIITRSEPLGCATLRDNLRILNHVAGIPEPHAEGDSNLVNTRMVVVQYPKGMTMNVSIFAYLESKKLIRAFDAVVMGEDGTGKLHMTPLLGKLVFTPPGKTKPVVYQWDAATTKYVPEGKTN